MREENTIKKALVCILSLALLLVLTACGKTKQPPAENPGTQDQVQTATPETAESISERDETDTFTEVSETVYATDTVNMRSGPGTQYDKLG